MIQKRVYFSEKYTNSPAATAHATLAYAVGRSVAIVRLPHRQRKS
jgi:hypothetical protein